MWCRVLVLCAAILVVLPTSPEPSVRAARGAKDDVCCVQMVWHWDVKTMEGEWKMVTSYDEPCVTSVETTNNLRVERIVSDGRTIPERTKFVLISLKDIRTIVVKGEEKRDIRLDGKIISAKELKKGDPGALIFMKSGKIAARFTKKLELPVKGLKKPKG